jgi:hypothetical protein
MIQVMVIFIMNYLIKQVWLWSLYELNVHTWIQKNAKKLYDRIQIFKIEIKLQRKFEKKMSINLIMQSTTIVFFIPTFYLTLILMFFHFIFI